MKSCCCEVDDATYYQGETKSGEKWTPAFIEYVDKEKCKGCGTCVKVCSRGVYEIQELNGRKISVAVNAGNVGSALMVSYKSFLQDLLHILKLRGYIMHWMDW